METEKKTETQPIKVEELSLADRIKLSETVNVYKDIKPGWYVDARDSVNNWCVAEVQEVNGNEIKVNFDGWSSRYDEVAQKYNKRLDSQD